MAIRIIGADERIRASIDKTSIFLVGGYGVGKTSLLYTLDAESTLCLDFESGMKSASTWRGDTIPIRTFEDACDIACLVGGANPALPAAELFSQAHFNHVRQTYPEIDLAKYKTIFYDSLSDLTEVAKTWAKQQPGAFNAKGAVDNRGMYGVLAENVTGLVRHMQHTAKTVIFVARLEQTKDDFGRVSYQPQMAGQKAGREIPGIVDAVISMSLFDYNAETAAWSHNFDSGANRAFCCHRLNPFGLPAKERSMGNVEMIEEPHLGNLISKINAPAKAEAAKLLNHSIKP